MIAPRHEVEAKMATRNTSFSARICGITVIAALVLCFVVTIAPRVVTIAVTLTGNPQDVDIMAMDD